MRRIKSDVPFLTDQELEVRADKLLDRAAREHGIAIGPPVPVEPIAEVVFDLRLDWVPLEDDTLARLNCEDWSIQPNERQRESFARYPGQYEFTLGHELFHAIEHVEDVGEQLSLDLTLEDRVAYRRQRQRQQERQWHIGATVQDRRRDIQADRFAGFLLMPKRFLVPAIQGKNVCDHATRIELARKFSVSLSAMTVRLQQLGCLYRGPDGRFYRSAAEATGQIALF